MFSHALSTHKAANDLDFFAAVDDEKKSDEDAGAGMIGTNEFTSATYYRYIGLNLDMLADKHHLKCLALEERRQVVDTFLRAALLALPDKGRKNSMNALVAPSYVLGIVKEIGQPMQLVNAFEKPIRSPEGFVEPSVKALKEHHESMKKTWNITIKKEIDIPSTDLDGFCAELIKHVV